MAAATFTSALTGCGLSSGISAQPTTKLSTTSPNSAAASSSATLKITDVPVGVVGSQFTGLAYEKSSLWEPLFTPVNSDLIGLFQRLGPGVLRLGGNTVDQSTWTPAGPGRIHGKIAPSDVTSLAQFLKATNWQCIYGINLGGAASGATTPALAADEAEFAARALGSALLGFELGNECDNYGDPAGYYPGNWSLAQFLALWSQFRNGIIARVPGAKMVGPASGENESSWTVPFSRSVSSARLSMITQHYYRGDGHLASSTAQNLLTPDPSLVQDLATLQRGARELGIPYRMAECNSYYNGGVPGVSDAYASALWAVDFLFTCAQGGAAGVNVQGGSDWTGYTPIADKAAVVVEARPEFYGLLFFTLAGTGTLCQTTIDAGSLNVSTYTLKAADGGLSVVVINKDSSTSLDLALSLPRQASAASLVQLAQLSSGAQSPSLAGTSGITIQGAAVQKDGSFSPQPASILEPHGSELNCTVAALSAILIKIP